MSELLPSSDPAVVELHRLKERLGNKPAEPVRVVDVVESVLATMRGEAEEHGLTVSLELADQPILPADQEQIRLLWTHLLQNAIRYTPPGGHISLSLQMSPLENKIIGTVADTGIGIAPEEIPRIFEEFYRTETAKTMQENGTGLGLPIVQQILSLYDGNLEIDSTPGRGSSFRFTMPLPERRPGVIA